MTFLAGLAFAKQFCAAPDDLDMAVVYDVSHVIAKVEEHLVDGKPKTLLVHRKGSTRAFGPHHPLIGRLPIHRQPVLIGLMGACSTRSGHPPTLILTPTSALTPHPSTSTLTQARAAMCSRARTAAWKRRGA